MTKPIYLGQNRTELSARFAVDGKRWDYHFLYPFHLDTIDYLCRKISAGKALAYAKRHAATSEQVHG